MNRIEITGRLVRDLELVLDKATGQPFKTKFGGHIVKGSIADQHTGKKGDVSYFDFVCYGNLADEALQNFGKGNMVNIAGWAKQYSWKDANGNRRTRWEIRANEINPVFQKSKTAPSTGDEKPAWVDDDDGLFTEASEE